MNAHRTEVTQAGKRAANRERQQMKDLASLPHAERSELVLERKEIGIVLNLKTARSAKWQEITATLKTTGHCALAFIAWHHLLSDARPAAEIHRCGEQYSLLLTNAFIELLPGEMEQVRAFLGDLLQVQA